MLLGSLVQEIVSELVMYVMRASVEYLYPLTSGVGVRHVLMPCISRLRRT